MKTSLDIDRYKLLHWWAMIRWFMLVVLLSIGLLQVSFKDTSKQGALILSVFGGVIALNMLFQIQALAQKRWVEIFQVVSDIVFATMIVHLTGGLNSFFVWVYLIGVITASLTIPQNGGLIAGLIGSMSLLFLIILYQNGVITPTEASSLDVAGSTVYILSYTGLFSGVALIANYLSDQISVLKHQFNENSKLQQQLDDYSRLKANIEELVPYLKDISHLDHDINTPLCVITLSLGRIKRYGSELQIEGLLKSNNEITDAVNRIGTILQRLKPLKRHPLLDYDKRDDDTETSNHSLPQSNSRMPYNNGKEKEEL